MLTLLCGKLTLSSFSLAAYELQGYRKALLAYVSCSVQYRMLAVRKLVTGRIDANHLLPKRTLHSFKCCAL